ncbi:MAG: nicotinamide-nucleotide adenylyltransferase, partial [Conexivisphaerales archaeon]
MREKLTYDVRGIFIGRFQPFHNGHAAALRYGLEKVDELVIVIGSAQKNHELENPFTAGERYEMIVRFLKSDGFNRAVYITPLDDIINHSIWTATLKSYLPKFDLVFSNNALVNMLASESGMKVIPAPLLDREQLMATRIRERIIKGEKWEHLVPRVVHDFLLEINGEERIKALAKAKEDI